MGTTFQAQVEVAFGERWQAVSRWELQKDYAFARAFYTIAKDEWPRKGGFMEESEERQIAHDLNQAIKEGARTIAEQLEQIDSSLGLMNDYLEQILEHLSGLDSDADEAG